MRRPAYAPANGEPFSMINTTPMIDVMLVILIMMMLSLPAATHKVPLDLPSGPVANGPPAPVRLLGIDARGRLSWDAQPISSAELGVRLAALAADPAEPVLQLKTDPEAPYERFDATIAAVKRAGVTQIGFVGNPATF